MKSHLIIIDPWRDDSQRDGGACCPRHAMLRFGGVAAHLERARDMWAELKRETDVARTQQLLDSLG